jgi:glycerol-3-phosphate O-acyltransferase
MLKDNSPGMDLYRLLRTGGSEESFSLPETYQHVDHSLRTVRELDQAGHLRLDDSLKKKDTVAVLSEALAHLGSYHRRPALMRKGDRLFHIDRNLLLYYQNRLAGFSAPGLEN